MTRDEIICSCLVAMDDGDLSVADLITEAGRLPLALWYCEKAGETFQLEYVPTEAELTRLARSTWGVKEERQWLT